MAKRERRLTLASLGEYYVDLLLVDSWITGRSQGVQGASLLCAKLQEREQRIRERIAYLAKKRGISSEDLWTQILSGTAQPMEPGSESDEDDG